MTVSHLFGSSWIKEFLCIINMKWEKGGRRKIKNKK